MKYLRKLDLVEKIALIAIVNITLLAVILDSLGIK